MIHSPFSFFNQSDNVAVIEGIAALGAEAGSFGGVSRLPAALVAAVLRDTGRLLFTAVGAETACGGGGCGRGHFTAAVGAEDRTLGDVGVTVLTSHSSRPPSIFFHVYIIARHGVSCKNQAHFRKEKFSLYKGELICYNQLARKKHMRP